MIYEFNSEDTVDDLKFKTNMLVEKYDSCLSIEAQCVSEFLTINSINQDNEVTVVIPHDEAIKLRDTLNAMYPLEQNKWPKN